MTTFFDLKSRKESALGKNALPVSSAVKDNNQMQPWVEK